VTSAAKPLWIVALGFAVAGCTLVTDMSDLTFADAASSSVTAGGGTDGTGSGAGGTGGTGSGAGGTGGCTPSAAGNVRRVFVTSKTYRGDLDMLGPGDAYEDAALECTALAAQACLGGAWKAWLSAAGKEPGTDYTMSPFALVNMNGAPLVDSLSTLFMTGNLQARIDRDEHNDEVPPANVWTGTSALGNSETLKCYASGDWTSVDPLDEGVVGTTTETSNAWSSSGTRNCDQLYRLYCFEQ
jgi:hypothetical protein